MATTLSNLHKLKAESRKFAVLTAYDATMSRILSESGIDLILIGDSLGMVIQGEGSTVPVTLDHMIYHTKAVARGNSGGALLMADMPYMTYHSPTQAVENAALLMQVGANIVKLEGGWLSETIKFLTQRGIPVCAHLGLTPQSTDLLGGYRVQGKTPQDAERILADAARLEEAGAQLLLLECVPAELGERITRQAKVPVIGIGAGPATDAQVLVLHDMLGLTAGRQPRFVKNFMAGQTTIQGAIKAYADAVKTGVYPAPEHTYI